MGQVLAALCRFDLRIPGCSSLKEKRHVLKTLIASLRQKFNVAVAEVDHHDLWQRSAIAVSSVGAQGYQLKKVIREVERHIDTFPAVEVIDAQLTLHGADD
jgi:uncharacterized protein YlxP (DUF503 family)